MWHTDFRKLEGILPGPLRRKEKGNYGPAKERDQSDQKKDSGDDQGSGIGDYDYGRDAGTERIRKRIRFLDK